MKLLFCLLSLVTAGLAADKQPVVRWSELASYVNGHKFSTVLLDGTTIKGRVDSVEAEGLAATVHGKKTVISREKLSSMTVHRDGKTWKIICPVIGFFGGGFLGGMIGLGSRSIEGIGTGVLIGVGAGTAAGVVGGIQADRHDIVITIAR